MGASVLVIEDNAANLELLMFLLRAFGHEPVAAVEGRQALDMARRKTPDLILCDLQLPVMDGYELAKRLRAEPVLRGVPLVAVTAFAMPGDREKAIAAGYDGYIPKPIDPESFITQLDPLLPPEARSRRVATAPAVPREGTKGAGDQGIRQAGSPDPSISRSLDPHALAVKTRFTRKENGHGHDTHR